MRPLPGCLPAAPVPLRPTGRLGTGKTPSSVSRPSWIAVCLLLPSRPRCVRADDSCQPRAASVTHARAATGQALAATTHAQPWQPLAASPRKPPTPCMAHSSATPPDPCFTRPCPYRSVQPLSVGRHQIIDSPNRKCPVQPKLARPRMPSPLPFLACRCLSSLPFLPFFSHPLDRPVAHRRLPADCAVDLVLAVIPLFNCPGFLDLVLDLAFLDLPLFCQAFVLFLALPLFSTPSQHPLPVLTHRLAPSH